ncbi:hypothetical protein RPN13_05730, partial [Staphylococcus aureus]|nr:hypothetical protein [Staphylococcus aureus]
DDILILIAADNQTVLKELMQQAFALAEDWCNKVGLSIRPDKVNVARFTRKYKLDPLTGLKLFGKEIQVTDW